MKFNPKNKLTEGMAANPLDHDIKNDKDITTLSQEAILTAMAAETDAINQYTQILDMVFMSEGWLKNLVTEPLTDIINEEKKHLAQISNLVSRFPNFSEKWNEGWKEAISGEDESEDNQTEEKPEEAENESESNKENNVEEDKVKEESYKSIDNNLLTEDVDYDNANFDTFNTESIKNVLMNVFNDLFKDREEINKLDNLLYDYSKYDALSPKDVDELLSEFVDRFNIDPENLDYIENQIILNNK